MIHFTIGPIMHQGPPPLVCWKTTVRSFENSAFDGRCD